MDKVGLDLGVSSRVFGAKQSKKTSALPVFKGNVKTKESSCSLSNLQAYHLASLPKISFGRRLTEHKSWGANVVKNKAGNDSTKFKVWAQNSDRVFVEIRPKSKNESLTQEEGFIKIEKDQNGKLIDIVPSDEKSEVIELEKQPRGIFEGISKNAKTGNEYRYLLVDKDGNIKGRKDPYAKQQNHVGSWSTIYDHDEYKWNDSGWTKTSNKKRIGRNNPKLLPTIAEVHVGIIDAKGNFDSVKKKIDEYAEKGTFNTIELMPVEGCYFDPKTGIGFNWGYDGVDKFAPTELYGGPDKLKGLIDYAHKKGINVMMDMVPNHMGPHGNYLSDFSPYNGDNTQWGDGFNYESGNQDERVLTRDYMTNVALNWLLDYHCDGLRLDMTQRMGSDFEMKQIALECRFHAPHSFITAEDARQNEGDGKKLNDARVIRHTSEDDITLDKSKTYKERENLHVDLLNKLDHNETSVDTLDYDSQWDFAFHHSLASLLLGQEFMDYQPNLSNFEFSFKNGPLNTKYLMSHDEVGNNDGTRFVSKVITAKLALFHRTEGSSPAEKGQRAANVGQKLLEAYLAKDDSIWNIENQRKLHVYGFISKSEFEGVYDEARALDRLGLGAVFMAPGPKMIFDGAEKGVASRFKFFAKHPDKATTDNISAEKGYDTGKQSFDDAKLKRDDYENFDEKFEKYSDDLFKLLNSSQALQSQDNSAGHLKTYLYNQANVMQVVRKEGDDEILSIMNFNNSEYDNFKLKNLPAGEWEEVINSNNKKYGGNSEYMNNHSHMQTSADASMDIKLPGNSIVIFKKKK